MLNKGVEFDRLGFVWLDGRPIDLEKVKTYLLTYHERLCLKYRLKTGKFAWASIIEDAKEKKILIDLD
jgi:hypothetical protein